MFEKHGCYPYPQLQESLRCYLVRGWDFLQLGGRGPVHVQTAANCQLAWQLKVSARVAPAQVISSGSLPANQIPADQGKDHWEQGTLMED